VSMVAPRRNLRGPDTDVFARLTRDGIAFLPELDLGDAVVSSIRAQLKGKPVVDQYDGVSRFDMDQPIPKTFTKLSYQLNDLTACRELVALANHPRVLDAATQLLGAPPTIVSFQAWWTLGENHEEGRLHYDDVYHRDVDDYRFVKLFAYLTDTSEKTGAHSYVKGSQRSNKLVRRGPITDEEVHQAFARQDIITIAGKAGTVFMEDTWGIHRPLLATEGRRLVFMVLYTLTPWTPPHAAEPENALPAGLDKRVNRRIFRRPE
jgi:Phytanoyl-CoA dioxygenase (PhyH)